MRVTPGSVNIPYARFPTPSTSPSTTTPDPCQVAQDFTSKFNAALEARDLATLKALFLDEGYWRDHLALTWAFRTANGPTQVHDLLSASASSRDGLRLKKITIDDSSAVRAPQVAPVDPAGKVPGVRFFVTVETAVGTGSGVVRLVPQDDGSYKIFTLYTRLEELAGHEQPVDGRRPRGVAHGHNPDRRNWAERRKEEVSMEGDNDPAVLIIGKFKQREIRIHGHPSLYVEVLTVGFSCKRRRPGRTHGGSPTQDAGRQGPHHRPKRPRWR